MSPINHTQRSQELFSRAIELIPGGVNSPVRAFRSVGLNPIYIERGSGPYIWDVDGNRYLDLIGSWGPMLLGHNPDVVKSAILEELDRGTSYGACNAREVEMAELICAAFPSIEKVRMVNSGTEATMSAIRLARGFTGRELIIKFEGCYHGHADSFLISAGSGLATFGQAGSAGITEPTIHTTLIATYNDLDSVRLLLDRHPEQVAAVIIEPIMGNMGLIPPAEGFLAGLRALTEERGVLLIFDEVISGFRASLSGAQGLYGIKPDITCLGKIIGGGLPVGAFGGRADIMDYLSPIGPVYQAGTLSGNPLAMAAGIAMLRELRQPDVYDRLEALGQALEDGVRPLVAQYPGRLSFNRIGSLSTLFFTDTEVRSNADAKRADTSAYARYFGAMLERGFYLPPSQFECMFLSLAHSDDDIQSLVQAMGEAIAIALND